jgi:hypothetical protein
MLRRAREFLTLRSASPFLLRGIRPPHDVYDARNRQPESCGRERCAPAPLEQRKNATIERSMSERLRAMRFALEVQSALGTRTVAIRVSAQLTAVTFLTQSRLRNCPFREETASGTSTA